MINWIRTGRSVTSEGTTTTYAGLSTQLTIESRKRHIPHANGRAGTWDHTTYWVQDCGRDVKELHSLADAKEWAEQYRRDEAWQQA